MDRRNRSRKKPEYQLKMARERMDILLDKAIEMHASRPDLARRYFLLAKKIGMRYNVRMPAVAKRRFCKKCFSYLSGGWRTRRGKVTVTCKACGHVMRYPYRERKPRFPL